MGAIADSIMAYAKPLLDGTDGSLEQMNKALAISQACWNLALLPEERRRAGLDDMRDCFQLGDEEFDEFERSILLPMIRRHEQMFPGLHGRGERGLPRPAEPAFHRPAQLEPPHWQPGLGPARSAMPSARPSEPATPGRYDPCPCNSGKKYKFCCGRRG